MSDKKITFEQAMDRLENIVKKLESGEAPLDESLAFFEEGINLIKFCGDALDNAEKKVSVLMKNCEGNYEERAFECNN